MEMDPSEGAGRMGDSAEFDKVAKCDVDNTGWCRTHAGMTKKIKFKSSKWAWLEKKKQYGYKYVTTTRIICSKKNVGNEKPGPETEYGKLARGIRLGIGQD